MFFFTASSVFADAIRLNSGQVLEGTILEESESVLVIKTATGTYSIQKSDILETEKPGSSTRIARVPKTEVTPLKGALMSFIPFYSGIYLTDRPTFGVPFAMVNGYMGLHLFLNLFQRKHVDFMDSDYKSDPSFAGRVIAYSNSRGCFPGGSCPPGPFIGTPLNGPFGEFFVYYRWNYSDPRNQDVKINGKQYNIRTADRMLRQQAEMYLTFSAISAGIAYLMLKSSASPAKSALLSGNMAYYALPVSRNSFTFGLVYLY